MIKAQNYKKNKIPSVSASNTKSSNVTQIGKGKDDVLWKIWSVIKKF